MRKFLPKLLSIKFWITVWGCCMITYIVASDRVEFLQIASFLCAVPLAYFGLNYLQKKLYNGAGGEKNEDTDKA